MSTCNGDPNCTKCNSEKETQPEFNNIDEVNQHVRNLTDDALKGTQDVAPGEFAAKMYGILVPQLEQQLPSLSKKGYARVVEALYKVPLMDFNKVLNKTEANIYAVLNRVLQCKMVMESEVLTEEYTKENVEMSLKPELNKE